MTRHFVYPVHDLRDGGRDYEEPLGGAWLAAALHGTELSACGDEPGLLAMRMSLSGRDVVVRGRLRVPVEVPCARCLSPTRHDVDTELTLLLMPSRASLGQARQGDERATRRASGRHASKQARARAADLRRAASGTGGGKGRWTREGDQDVYEFAGGEAEIDTYDGDEVVLDPYIREAILLEAPIFPLCSEACPGIGPLPVGSARAARVPAAADRKARPVMSVHRRKTR
jgi:uncharacterized protein